jgi:hypothetical protein
MNKILLQVLQYLNNKTGAQVILAVLIGLIFVSYAGVQVLQFLRQTLYLLKRRKVQMGEIIKKL